MLYISVFHSFSCFPFCLRFLLSFLSVLAPVTLLTKKKEVNININLPLHTMWAHGLVEVGIRSFLTSTKDGGEWSV